MESVKQNCIECGKRIPKERLEALPWTKRCVKCSDEQPLSADQVDVDGLNDEDANRNMKSNFPAENE